MSDAAFELTPPAEDYVPEAPAESFPALFVLGLAALAMVLSAVVLIGLLGALNGG